MSVLRDHNDRRLFEALVRSHQGRIRAFLAKLCKNTALADDLAQDTFLRAYQKFDMLADRDCEKTWLFKIAYRIFLDYFRKQSHRKKLSHANMSLEIGVVESAPGTKMDIEQAMNALPSEQRAAILLNISYGLSHGEISNALGLPLGTVKSHIARGKNTLRAFLNAYERA